MIMFLFGLSVGVLTALAGGFLYAVRRLHWVMLKNEGKPFSLVFNPKPEDIYKGLY